MFFPSPDPGFIWSTDENGLFIRFASSGVLEKARSGRGSEAALMALLRMRMLVESEGTGSHEIDGGVFLPSAESVRLDTETRELFGLPAPWPGSLKLDTQHYPRHPQFHATLVLISWEGTPLYYWKMRGPLLEAGGDEFLLNAEQWAAVQAYEEWDRSAGRGERRHWELLANLREIQRRGCSLELGTYEEWPVEAANDLAVTVAHDPTSGGLNLGVQLDTPAGRVTAAQMAAREHQLADPQAAGIVRVVDAGQLTVLLTEPQTAQARRILANPRVPAEQKEAFLKDPSRWLVEHRLRGVPGEFSPRVLGLEYWKDLGLGPMSPSEIDWTVQRPEPETPEETASLDGERMPADGDSVSSDKADPVVTEILDNIRTRYGRPAPASDAEPSVPLEPDFSRYVRPPKPHQIDAVRRLLACADRAWSYGVDGGGAVFADDMGLGKTYATLVFLGEWMRHRREVDGKEPSAVLIVAPLTLIANWREEILKAYRDPEAVFSRTIDLQSDKDQQRFRDLHLEKDETVENADGQPILVRPALIYGREDASGVDTPGSLVLATYETMRRFNLSFAQCNWSMVVFDEAQALKNPNAIQTITAKSLRARFRLLMTGTPIENGLRDFWCLFDTAEPGLLETWVEFQKTYVTPLVASKENVLPVLERLKAKVGFLMLRRMKEEMLEGLPPKKTILRASMNPDDFDPRVSAVMSGEQLLSYNEARSAGIDATRGGGGNPGSSRHVLAALWNLREATLHPALVGGGSLPVGKDRKEAIGILQRSAKLAKLLDILSTIEKRREKVLIFAIGKKLQAGLAANLSRIYGTEIPVINGDTPTTSARATERTRMGMLRQFMPSDVGEQQDMDTEIEPPGFGIAILSPIAAGVGLTLTEANHVIHLERHWNPAKEAQATDRVYRIGQKRTVHVWIPILKHPELPSFDVNLNRLLENKSALHHALSIPEAVDTDQILDSVFDTAVSGSLKGAALTREDIMALSGYLFEALVAELFVLAGASRVVLTPESSDHGCDVAVLDTDGKTGDNWLIQCKHTTQKKLKGDMPVREIVGSRWHYETHLGVKFSRLAVVSTARRFDRQCRSAAAGQDVELLDASWLTQRLRSQPVTKASVLKRHAMRQRIG